MVNWLHDLSCFFGGMFLANAMPHWISGMMGRPFQSPFAHPHGVGLSSSTVNVVWGLANIVAAYVLLVSVAHVDIHDAQSMVALGLGAFLISLFAARHFGHFHGGNLKSQA